MRQNISELDDCFNIANAIKLCDKNFLKDIFTFQESMKAKRMKERETNRRTISELCISMKGIAVDVRDPKKLRGIDLNELRSKLQYIHERIHSFKTQNEFNLKKLQDEEMYLTTAVDRFTDVIYTYEETEELKLLPVPKITNHCSSDPKTEEVVQFEKFLHENGGHNGGWEEEDHLLFLHYLKQYRHKPKFIEALQVRLPGLSENDIIKHDKWYKTYLALREKQRHAIRKWRVEKEQQRNKNRELAPQSVGIVANDDAEAVQERKKKLEEWKQKRLEKKKQEEENILKAKQAKMRKEHERRQQQEMKKAAVEVYKKEKMCQQNAHLLLQELKELKEREEKATQANMLLKSFRQQDEIYMERKRLYNTRKTKKKEFDINRWRESLRRSGLSVGRDPDRLLRPTLSWNDRLLSKAQDFPNKPILHLRNIPHLGVPSWRKGLVS